MSASEGSWEIFTRLARQASGPKRLEVLVGLPRHFRAYLDDGLTKDVLLRSGWADLYPPKEALYNLRLDPAEGVNWIDDPALAGVLSDLKVRLHSWMVATDDPLLRGPVPPAKGTSFNTVDQVSPSDPTTAAS